MSTTTATSQTSNPIDPQAHLLAEVAVPEYFAKLAQETGITPSDPETSQRLLGSGNLVLNTVNLYLEKRAAHGAVQGAGLVKAATDAAFGVAGMFQQEEPKPGRWLENSSVRDAALMMVADAMAKQAGAAQLPTPAAGTGTEAAPEVPAAPTIDDGAKKK